VRAAAETFRPNPRFSAAEVITELGLGEALCSFLEGKGTPSMVERTLIRPPSARIGPVTPEERQAVMARSPVRGTYDVEIDRESAFEMLQTRAAGKAGGTAESEPAAAGGLGGLTGTVLDTVFGGGADARRGSRRGRESLAEAVAKSAGRAIASTAGRQITNAILRGVLGSLTRR